MSNTTAEIDNIVAGGNSDNTSQDSISLQTIILASATIVCTVIGISIFVGFLYKHERGKAERQRVENTLRVEKELAMISRRDISAESCRSCIIRELKNLNVTTVLPSEPIIEEEDEFVPINYLTEPRVPKETSKPIVLTVPKIEDKDSDTSAEFDDSKNSGWAWVRKKFVKRPESSD